jgi:hypothetical protein
LGCRNSENLAIIFIEAEIEPKNIFDPLLFSFKAYSLEITYNSLFLFLWKAKAKVNIGG